MVTMWYIFDLIMATEEKSHIKFGMDDHTTDYLMMLYKLQMSFNADFWQNDYISCGTEGLKTNK